MELAFQSRKKPTINQQMKVIVCQMVLSAVDKNQDGKLEKMKKNCLCLQMTWSYR